MPTDPTRRRYNEQAGQNESHKKQRGDINSKLDKARELGIEIPDRAIWIRMLMSELNRVSSHLLFMATNGMDLGAVGMMIYGWREREEVLQFFEKTTGLRMNHNYIRPGGVAVDLPDDWKGGFVLLWLIALISAFLDNIAAAIIGGTVAAAIYQRRVHIGYIAAIVAASNAGGAGSVVGDTKIGRAHV